MAGLINSQYPSFKTPFHKFKEGADGATVHRTLHVVNPQNTVYRVCCVISVNPSCFPLPKRDSSLDRRLHTLQKIHLFRRFFDVNIKTHIVWCKSLLNWQKARNKIPHFIIVPLTFCSFNN